MNSRFTTWSIALASCLLLLAPASGEPPKKGPAKELIVTAHRMFTGAEFAKALADNKLTASIGLDGLAKKSATPDAIDFSPGLSCKVKWIAVPISMIDKVEWLGKFPCPHHVYDHIAIYFKEPKGEAAVFAQLLQAHRTPRDVEPIISEIAPTKVKRNSVGTLTVYGNNFSSGCYVLVDDVFLATTFVSAQKLTAQLTTGVTGTPGAKEVKVHDTNTGGLSNTVTLTVTP